MHIVFNGTYFPRLTVRPVVFIGPKSNCPNQVKGSIKQDACEFLHLCRSVVSPPPPERKGEKYQKGLWQIWYMGGRWARPVFKIWPIVLLIALNTGLLYDYNKSFNINKAKSPFSLAGCAGVLPSNLFTLRAPDVTSAQGVIIGVAKQVLFKIRTLHQINKEACLNLALRAWRIGSCQ